LSVVCAAQSVCKGALCSLKGLYLQNNKLAALGFKPTLLPGLRKMSIGGNQFSKEEKMKLAKSMEEGGITDTSHDAAGGSK